MTALGVFSFIIISLFQGFVHPVKPLNACAPVEPPPDNVSTWIALIARDNCTFADKVVFFLRFAESVIE